MLTIRPQPFLRIPGNAARIAVAGTSIVWANAQVAKSHVAIGAAKLDGTSPIALYRSAEGVPLDVSGLATDATYVYFAATAGDGAVRRVPVAGGCPDVLVKPTKTGDLVSDAASLSFIDLGNPSSNDAFAKP